jgi:hypothetical protein
VVVIGSYRVLFEETSERVSFGSLTSSPDWIYFIIGCIKFPLGSSASRALLLKMAVSMLRVVRVSWINNLFFPRDLALAKLDRIPAKVFRSQGYIVPRL